MVAANLLAWFHGAFGHQFRPATSPPPNYAALFIPFAFQRGYQLLKGYLTGTNDNVIHRQHFLCFIFFEHNASLLSFKFLLYCTWLINVTFFSFSGSTMDPPVVFGPSYHQIYPYCALNHKKFLFGDRGTYLPLHLSVPSFAFIVLSIPILLTQASMF